MLAALVVVGSSAVGAVVHLSGPSGVPLPPSAASVDPAASGSMVATGPDGWTEPPREATFAGPDRAAPLSGSPGSGPVRATEVRIPVLGVRSALLDLGVDPAGALVPPAVADVAGWFTGGAVPGEPGPAVIAGHVDSRSGPGVFLRLGDIPVGAQVEVDRADGSTARFRVVAVERVGKDEFPTAQVYGPTPVPRLSLVTCGGEFDQDVRHYRDNVVVTAVPASP